MRRASSASASRGRSKISNFSDDDRVENVLVGAHTVTKFKPERKARQLAMETIDYVGSGPIARLPAISDRRSQR